jgi:predicted nucleotide-binding protein (sugar kinase/HSP70/actin superfamily)
MKDLQLFIDNVLDIFTTKKSTSKEIFKDFVSYFYFTIDNKINSTKQESIKNKYIKIRQSAIRYIVANEKAITSEICRNQRNK